MRVLAGRWPGARRARLAAHGVGQPGGTPDVATCVTTAVAVLFIASGTFQTLIALASVFLAVSYCVCCLVLVALRRREPERGEGAWLAGGGLLWRAGVAFVRK